MGKKVAFIAPFTLLKFPSSRQTFLLATSKTVGGMGGGGVLTAGHKRALKSRSQAPLLDSGGLGGRGYFVECRIGQK